jgi:hypothetical protein
MKRFWPLLVLAVVLSVASGCLTLTFAGRRHVDHVPFAWFHASAELSAPTFFSVATMFAAGVGCWRQLAAPRWCWRLLGTLLCFLAIDDLCMLHEQLGHAVHHWFEGAGVYGWVLVLGPVFASIGGFCAWHLWWALAAEPARRNRMLAGFVVLGLALGCEALEDAVVQSGWRPRGIELLAYSQWIEESLELLGPVLLLSATWLSRVPPQAGAPISS